MRILITGASGFIGTNLVPELRQYGHDVHTVDINDGDLTIGGIAPLPTMATYLIDKIKPDIVIHLAGLVGRLFGEDNPKMTIQANALSTTYIAQACAASDIRLAYASTSEAFGDHGDKHVPDNANPVLPYNLYGLSKRWGEEAARLYMPKDKLQIFRLSMPYGPGLPAGRGRAALINFLWNAHHGKPLTVHRGGRRCWCWIGDAVCGIRMLIEDGGSGLWLVGRDDNEVTMLEVAEMACDMADAPRSLIIEVEPPINQTVVKRLMAQRLKGIGWKPEISLEEGIRRTYNAVKQYDKEGKPPHEI